MILLPVIERELRVAARRKQTYWNRFLAALVVFGIFIWLLSSERGVSQAHLGGRLFSWITMAALVMCALAGLAHTADCITSERRDGTLGLLFLTDLRSSNVIGGKLFANSLPAFFTLATIAPALAIPFLLGGVVPGEVARAVVVLVVMLSLSLAAGLLASTLARGERGAMLLTLFLVGIPTLVLPMVDVGNVSAFWSMIHAQELRYIPFRYKFWSGLGAQAALICLFFALAVVRARSLWREAPQSAADEKIAKAWRVWSTGNAKERASWRGELLDENPAIWLSCRRRVRTAIMWAILGSEAVFLTWMFFMDRRLDSGLVAMTSVLTHWVLKVAVAFAAERALFEEARSGGFELLFTTHLTPGMLIRGHLAGMLRSFGVAFGVVLAGEIVWLALGGAAFVGRFAILREVFLVLDLATIAVVAMAMGLRSKRAGRGALKSLLFVVILPNLAWILMLSGQGALGALFVIWFVFDAAAVVWALNILKNLRLTVSEPAAASSSRE